MTNNTTWAQHSQAYAYKKLSLHHDYTFSHLKVVNDINRTQVSHQLGRFDMQCKQCYQRLHSQL